MTDRIPLPLIRAFLAVEGLLYAVFLPLDLTGRGGETVPFKYAGILLCLAFALLCAAKGGDKLVSIALALTAGADWFLLVRNDCYALGIALFLCVQTVYLVRLRQAGIGIPSFRVVGPALGANVAVCAAGMASPVNLLAALYFTLLLSNAMAAWTLKGKRWRRFALGLTLFVGCDVCVGLFNALPAASPLYPAVSVGMWLFYLPSQVLIALTALPEKGDLPCPVRSAGKRRLTMNKTSRSFSVLLSAAIALVLFTGAVAAPILCRPFYYAHIGPLQLAERTGLTEAEIRTAFDEMLDYCLGNRSEFSTGVLTWSESGRDHFTDVRALFLLDLRALACALCLLAALAIFARWAKRRPALLLGRGPAFWAGAGLGGGFLVIGALAALDFDRAFTLFHALFFPGKDNWMFDPGRDQIINILPQEFFRNCAILILAILVLGCAALILYDLLRGKNRNNRPSKPQKS